MPDDTQTAPTTAYPTDAWVQIGGDMNPGDHGGLFARMEITENYIEIHTWEIQPKTAVFGDEAYEKVSGSIPCPFWTREGYADTDDVLDILQSPDFVAWVVDCYTGADTDWITVAVAALTAQIDGSALDPTVLTPSQWYMVAVYRHEHGYAEEGQAGWRFDKPDGYDFADTGVSPCIESSAWDFLVELIERNLIPGRLIADVIHRLDETDGTSDAFLDRLMDEITAE